MIAPTSEILDTLARRTSDDPDTQTACVAVICGKVIAEASNRIPTGVLHLPERLSKPLKYSYIMHAESRMVASCALSGTSLDGATVYLNWFPCVTCASLLVQAGIRTLAAHQGRYEVHKDDPRYGFEHAMAILREGGITLQWIGRVES